MIAQTKRLRIYILKEKGDKHDDWSIVSSTLYRDEAADWKSEHSPRWARYRDFDSVYLDIPEYIYNEAERSPE